MQNEPLTEEMILNEIQYSEEGWDNGGFTFHYRKRLEEYGLTIWFDSKEHVERCLRDKSFP